MEGLQGAPVYSGPGLERTGNPSAWLSCGEDTLQKNWYKVLCTSKAVLPHFTAFLGDLAWWGVATK